MNGITEHDDGGLLPRQQSRFDAAPLFGSLGNDLWVSREEEGAPTIVLNGKTYSRFLDRLYIPGPTTSLSIRQVVAINRYREQHIASDPQFTYRDAIRQLFAQVLSDLRPVCVAEIGPGRFPLSLPQFRSYSAVEIDPVAIEYLRSCDGISVIDQTKEQSLQSSIDICFSLFAFHFDISYGALAYLARSMTKEGIFVFNVVTHSPEVRTRAICKLSRLGFYSRCIDLEPKYSKEDVIFICSRSRGSDDRLFSAFERELHGTGG